MFGLGKIDSVGLDRPLCYSLVGDSNRPGALRGFAEQIAAEQPSFFAVHGIDAGDALALATRFNAGWAYRGRQALFWNEGYRAHDVHDRYLPAPPLRPFDRRGLLEVYGDFQRKPLTLVGVALASDRSSIRELRFLRSRLRKTGGTVLLFVAGRNRAGRIGFGDLGFERARASDGCEIYVKV